MKICQTEPDVRTYRVVRDWSIEGFAVNWNDDDDKCKFPHVFPIRVDDLIVRTSVEFPKARFCWMWNKEISGRECGFVVDS